jgi:putative cell wall-binding protein
MRKLISLLVMILLLLSAALAETSSPTCTTVTLATGSVRGGFPREDA